MVRFSWGLNYCHNTMYSPHLSVWYNDLTYETSCQVLFYLLFPLYINHLAAAISLLKGDTLLYTLDQQLSSVFFKKDELFSQPLPPRMAESA